MESLFKQKATLSQIRHKASVLASFCVSVIVSISCSDMDVEGSRQTDEVNFDVSISEKWNNAFSRSSENNLPSHYEAHHLNNSELWLITTEKEGIDSTHFDSSYIQTRGTTITNNNFYDSFGVYAYTYTGDGTWDDNKSNASTYINGEQVTKSGSLWSLSDTRFWPGSQYNMKFTAYAPYGLSNFSITDNTPTISYTVPTEATNQKDVLLASSDAISGDYNQTLSLNFKHILTAVKVKVMSGITGTITKVAISGVKGSGTYTYSSSGGSWATSDDNCSYSVDMQKVLSADASEATEIIGDEDGTTFMMIPQTLGEEATLTVTFSDGTILEGSLSGKEWPIGYTVTYRISTTDFYEDPVFDVTEPTRYTYLGGTKSYTVQSYSKQAKNGTETLVAKKWKAECVKLNENTNEYETIETPTWLNLGAMSGNGIASESDVESYNAVVEAQTETIISYPTFEEESINETSGLEYYNLSNSEGKDEVQNTANCYLINRCGKYRFPLVYGNAVKDGNANTTAYTSTISNRYVLKNFVNHLDRSITNPYIYNNTDANGNHLSAGSATLVWQDAKGIISDVSLSEDKHFVTFNVNKDNLVCTNAVIAVKDSEGNVMWSWHIWVTNYILGDNLKEISNSANTKEYLFMPINLGWCETSTTKYYSRSVEVRFTQIDTGLEEIITIYQDEAEIPKDGNQPYYQWGRKDPMLPSNGSSQSWINKTWYDAEGNEYSSIYKEVWDTGHDVIVKGILNPYTFCPNDRMDDTYLNLWSTSTYSNASITSEKSIYDPCPVGYKVPNINAFSNFTASNGGFSKDPKGFVFSCTSNGEPSSIYLPILGCRERNNTAGRGGEFATGSNWGYCWTSTPNSTYHGCRISMTSDGNGQIQNTGSMMRAYGFPIRPIKDN